MRVIPDEAWKRFLDATKEPAFTGLRLAEHRHTPLEPGGRCRLTLFEQAEPGGRAHPRLRTDMPPVEDPSPPERLYTPLARPPTSVEAFLLHAREVRDAAWPTLRGEELPADLAPAGSPHYWRNSLRVQRTRRFFEELRASLDTWLRSGALPAEAAAPARYGVRELEADTYAGTVLFDDADTGTYHSYLRDAPFVHFLERMIASLPEEGTEAFAVLGEEEQQAVLRQRRQARRHLDYLMRYKYAFAGILETDIERTLGGLLIDRETRHLVSEPPGSQQELVPRYELLRVAPEASHPHAGAWVYRDGEQLRLEDGTPLEVEPSLLRSTPVPAARLTFLRAPEDPRLRAGVRFDWDGDGAVRPEPVDWVAWAGHCDIKAILEALGVTLTGPGFERPSLTEYRSDTGRTTEWNRELLLEMLASSLEFGSGYTRAEGGGYVTLGVHDFGGARNDSLPDRLQFTGLGPGQHFRWPMTGREERFLVTSIEEDGTPLDMDTVFLRYLPDLSRTDFSENPRYLKTLEGDYNLIDVSGARLRARVRVDRFDSHSGYPVHEVRDTFIDLSPQPVETRCFLGTELGEVSARELYELWLEREPDRIVAERVRYERDASGLFVRREVPEGTVSLPLASPLRCTLSREMKEDDPALFQTLLDEAIRRGRNICADTDMRAEVWNGVVLQLDSRRLESNRERRVERWRVDVRARFGRAGLDYLVRLDEEGHSVAWCPVPGIRKVDFLWLDWPDVGSKVREGEQWLLNTNMAERGVVEVERSPEAPGGVLVHDEQVESVYEVLWAALAGYRYAVVHDNERWVFRERAQWEAAVARLESLRGALRFE